MDTTQPTILVKRSDGTTARVTLDEFKKMKSGTPKAEPKKVEEKPKQEVKPEISTPKVEKKVEVKKEEAPAPVKIKADAEKKKDSWEDDDHKSLLDDEFHKEKPTLVKEGEHILARTAPVKDIFVDEAEYKMKEKDAKVQTPVNPKMEFEKPGTVKNIRLADDAAVLPKSRPPVPRSVMPAPKPLAPKPVIQDIKPPKVEKQTVGPVDELKNFTLEDFRRLGMNTADSAKKLREKFKYLEEDSYLVFMDGVEAWYNSPLYRQYQEVIAKSLNNKMPVSEILSGAMAATDLKPEEFKAILKLNDSLY